MKKNEKRNLATSLTSIIFTVVGTTGVLMYFKLFMPYIKDLHEVLGLAFFTAVFFHVFFNWSSMKKYFTNKIFFFIVIGISVVTLSFIVNSLNDKKSGDPRRLVIQSIIKSPIEYSFGVLNIDKNNAFNILSSRGMDVEDMESIDEIAISNDKSPFEVLKMLVNLNKK